MPRVPLDPPDKAIGLCVGLSKDCLDYTARLPVELFSSIFDLLEQPDVLRVARVSHQWRNMATAHKNYYARLNLLPSKSAPWSADWELQVARFCNQLRRCRRRGVRTSIYLVLEGGSSAWYHDLGGWPQEERCRPRDLYSDRVIPALKESVGGIMRLLIQGRSVYAEDVYSALSFPAPHLELFVLEFSESVAEHSSIPPPPAHLFARYAPRLHTVKLNWTPLPATPVTAFSNVANVELVYRSAQAPLRHIMASFTRPVRLSIRCGRTDWDWSSNQHPQPSSFGPRIHKLKITWGYNGPLPRDLAMALAAQAIPVIDADLCFSEITLAHFLHYAPSRLNLTFYSHTVNLDPYCVGVTLRIEGCLPDAPAPFLRGFNAQSDKFSTQLIPQLVCIQTRIVELVILHSLLADLVRTVHRLPELQLLSINVTGHVLSTTHRPSFWLCGRRNGVSEFTSLNPEEVPNDCDPRASEPGPWPDVEPSHTLDVGANRNNITCPALRRLVLSNDSLERLAFVNRRELVHLGRDLSLLRSKPAAILCLKGTTLYGSAHIGLSMMFSEIIVTKH